MNFSSNAFFFPGQSIDAPNCVKTCSIRGVCAENDLESLNIVVPLTVTCYDIDTASNTPHKDVLPILCLYPPVGKGVGVTLSIVTQIQEDRIG